MLFRVSAVYEEIVEISTRWRIFRIEILCCEEYPRRKRVRIWLNDFYNLYPSDINSGRNGEDLKACHSCEEINIDITNSVIDDNDLLLGGKEIDDSSLLEYSLERINWYVSLLCN